MHNHFQACGGKDQVAANRASKACGRERRHILVLAHLEPLRASSSAQQAKKKYLVILDKAKQGCHEYNVLKNMGDDDVIFPKKDGKVTFSTRQSRSLKVNIDEQWYQELRSLL